MTGDWDTSITQPARRSSLYKQGIVKINHPIILAYTCGSTLAHIYLKVGIVSGGSRKSSRGVPLEIIMREILVTPPKQKPCLHHRYYRLRKRDWKPLT